MLAALSSSTKMIEVVILVVVVILLGTILVLYRRQSRPAKSGSHAASAASPASYYADVGTMQAPVGVGGGHGQSDPFAGFGAGPQFGGPPPAQAPPPPPPPAPASMPQMPPVGTPAGWMPDPSGAPDTLRYWDGASWTQHVATRS